MKRVLSETSEQLLSENENEAVELTGNVHQARRAATRERLIGATIDLLQREGVAAVTTVSVTKAAGIVQSGFYLHFKNIDECKQAAAERVAERIRKYVTYHRREMHRLDPNNLDLLRRHCEKMLALFDKEGHFTELFLRYRYDPSPLGEVMRKLHEQLRIDLAVDLVSVFALAEPNEEQRERINLQAEIILAAALAVGSAIIEERVAPVEKAAEMLAVNILAATNAIFPRDSRQNSLR